MFVSGFTIVRNAIKFDYPIVPAIESVLPLVDEMVVAVGNSEDQTRALIENINSPKIRIIDTIWDDSLRTGGRVLAVETDKAFKAISPKSTWGIYIQADEVLHENGYAQLKKAMDFYADKKEINGLLLPYTHFYGSYDFVGRSRRWYRNEIRVVRNIPEIHSWKDAQGFRINEKKIAVAKVDAPVHHYGWVKHPKDQQEKQKHFHKMWHDDNWIQENVKQTDAFDYGQVEKLERFSGQHPLVIQKRIKQQNWQFDFDPVHNQPFNKEQVLLKIEQVTGKRLFEYRNYLIKDIFSNR